jgi:peptidoglycan/xylan/chitin deacetylase (PgdA/CDA1 family)
MAYLRAYCHPMGLEDLVRAAGEGALPEFAVAVTLDDGYREALRHASAILLDLAIPATFFVTAAALHSDQENWWDTLRRILGPEATLPPRLPLTLGGRSTVLATDTWPARAAARRAVHAALLRASLDERTAVMAELAAWSGLDLAPRESHRVMTDVELRQLTHLSGHTVGAHGVHHLSLPHQPLATRRREVAEGRAHLEELIGRPVRAFAYPYGAFDSQTVEVVRAAGFLVGATTDPRLLDQDTDPLAVPRIEVERAWASHLPRHLAELFGGSRPALR